MVVLAELKELVVMQALRERQTTLPYWYPLPVVFIALVPPASRGELQEEALPLADGLPHMFVIIALPL